MTKEQKRDYMRLYRKKYRAEIRLGYRLWRANTKRRWWALARAKAGVPLEELPELQ